MKTLLQLKFAFVALLLAAALPEEAVAAGASRDAGVTIRVEGEGWGKATREEVEALLYAVADELVSGPDRVFDHPIVVSYAAGSPVTLYRRGPAGEYLVRLSARDRHWAQFAYQFGHELCHIMSNYAAGADAHGVAKRNQWFEEALCETAGLFALRSMAATWQTEAPYPSWEDYAPALRAYADRLAAEPHRQLPAGIGAGHWLRTRLAALTSNPYRREDNEVVATLLLPLFEQDRERWAALHALNLAPDDASVALPAYLRNWQRNAAPAQRPFVAEVLTTLGMADDDGPAPQVPVAHDGTATPALSVLQAGSAGPGPD